MEKKWEYVLPGEIETRSFAIIDEEYTNSIHIYSSFHATEFSLLPREV